MRAGRIAPRLVGMLISARPAMLMLGVDVRRMLFRWRCMQTSALPSPRVAGMFCPNLATGPLSLSGESERRAEEFRRNVQRRGEYERRRFRANNGYNAVTRVERAREAGL